MTTRLVFNQPCFFCYCCCCRCCSSYFLSFVTAYSYQVPDLTIWYGPDTYMGENLHNMILELSHMDDEQIRAVHPAHTQAREREGDC